MFAMTHLEYQTVYNMLSFSLASMLATTIYLWFRTSAVKDQYQSAVLIAGLVTFISAYHYYRIFNSWVDAYHYEPQTIQDNMMIMGNPTMTGTPFNDTSRYMDWLMTMPLLLIEILLVMNLDKATYESKSWLLGIGAGLMIVTGYYGDLIITGDLTPRWRCWCASMCFFLYIVYELLIGLAGATNTEPDQKIKSKLKYAQTLVVVSMCTYPIVYLFPMIGFSGPSVVVMIQVGYCISDIISKCGVGVLVYQITYAKSHKVGLLPA